MIGRRLVWAALLAVAGCTPSRAVDVDPLPGAEARWSADPDLDRTWRAQAAAADLVLQVTREGDVPVLHVQVRAGSPPDDAPLAASLELDGVPAGTRVGTAVETLGWHRIRETDVSTATATKVPAGHVLSLHVPSRTASATDVFAGEVRGAVVLARGGATERVPFAFRIAD